MTDPVQSWLDRYLTAWASNDPDDIRALFTADATYARSPWDAAPWSGHDGIVAGWLEAKDEAGDWRFDGWPLAWDDDRRVGVVKGRTDYADGLVYATLWVIRFDEDDRAAAFTEWWVQPDEA